MATTRPSRLTGLMALLLVTACGKGTDAALEAARAREAAAIAARGSDSALVKKYDVKDVTLAIPTDPAAIARGEHLAQAVVVCVECHGEDLSGQVLPMGGLGDFTAPNLTAGKGGVGGSYRSDAEWIRNIRHGVRADGTPLVFMPSAPYQHLSDEDLAAILAWVRSKPAVDKEHPDLTIGPDGHAVLAANPGLIIAAAIIDHQRVPPARVTPGRTVEYGMYLANIAGCTHCHGPALKGGLQLGAPGTPPSTDLTSTGPMAQWTEAQFAMAVQGGVRPEGTGINPFMPWKDYRFMTADEVGAIFDYIRAQH